jgi:hypothetical protein
LIASIYVIGAVMVSFGAAVLPGALSIVFIDA